MAPDSTATAAAPRLWPDDHPILLPLAPMVYCAWSDGHLTAEEIAAFRDHVLGRSWVPDDAAEALTGWLDPAEPPSPVDLSRLSDRIQEVGLDDDALPADLTALGLRLGAAHGEEDLWDDAVRADLRGLEETLGVVGGEAVRATLERAGQEEPTEARPEPSFRPEALRDFLDADHRGLRDDLLDLLSEDAMQVPHGTPSPEHRERALDAVQLLADRGYGGLAFPEELGGAGDPGGAIAVFETLAFGDLSILVKYGVQFGLFGGSVYQLGTRWHHETFLPGIASLELPGCYAMTETGHGSNVRDLETTATYDPETDELVVDTPREEAGKDWIGNAALHGRMATVFARLLVDGEDHGVHALLVPIRHEDGSACPGVRIEDRGLKEGLNGVDNGRLWFDGVRVPRRHLLDRFAHIDDDGTYHSPIPSSGRRFFTMLGTLVAGRVSIAAASVSASKTALTIAVRHGERRRQFGPAGADREVPILDYLAHQRLLLPRLATTIGLHLATRDLQRRFARSASEDGEKDDSVEVRAAGLKAYASWHAVDTIQACREACGGVGYLAENRFGRLLTDADIFTTFEGANAVLLQLVAKGLLSGFRSEMGDLRLWGAVRYLADRTQTQLTELNPVVTRRTDEDHLRDPDVHLAAFRYREERLLRSLALRLKDRIDDGVDTFQALNECQDHVLETALAHVERLVVEGYREAVARAPSPGLSEALGLVGALFALSRMEAHRGWYLEAGYLEAGKSRAIRAQVNALCGEVRELAGFLVDAFGIPDDVLRAPAAL